MQRKVDTFGYSKKTGEGDNSIRLFVRLSNRFSINRGTI